MKISAIQTNNFKLQNNKVNTKQVSQNPVNNNYYSNLPTTAQYLAFMGGYSVNLAETYRNLKPEQYPFDIHEAVEQEIKAENPAN